MRRILAAYIVIIALVVFAAGVWADSNTGEPAPPTVIQPPDDWISAPIKVTDLAPVPRSADAAPAADSCADASPLDLSFHHTADGSGTLTNLYTTEPDDPPLACQFGSPPSPQGFRTAWYSLTAGSSSAVTITTEGTDYDTVLGVFEGGCDALQPLACSDDFRGLQSSVTFNVLRGRTYHIVVADYQPGTPGAATALVSAVMEEGGARWTPHTTMPFGGVSRHAFVSDGPLMYVIGGQTTIGGVAELSNKLLRYNVELGQWAEMSDVPGAGLANTTAVRLGPNIYVPGGFDGNTSDYANKHWVYNTNIDLWTEAAPVPANLLPNGEMFAWSAGAPGPGETAYYLAGGITSYHATLEPNAVVIANTYRYTPATNEWAALQPMTAPRYAHTAAWVSAANRGLCVAGGLSTGQDDEGEEVIVLLSNGECYNPAAGGGWQPTGELNFPRYNAGSAIGPDGRWYIFGGVDAAGGVPETEVYNPATNSWQTLGHAYSLGGLPQNPAREWPRGAFFGGALFVFGGNTVGEQRVISAVEAGAFNPINPLGANNLLLPLVTVPRPRNLLENAVPLPLNLRVTGNFSESTQFYNPYYFDVPSLLRISVRLSNIPLDSNFNISVYDARKVLRGRGNITLYGGEKDVSLTLPAGRYYILVERVFPKDLPDPRDHYELIVTPGG